MKLLDFKLQRKRGKTSAWLRIWKLAITVDFTSSVRKGFSTLMA